MGSYTDYQRTQEEHDRSRTGVGAQESRGGFTEASDGAPTILVVEDEDAVREILQEILEMDGYHVLAVSNPLAALPVIEQYAGSIQLMVTDVSLPQMSGDRLAAQLRMVRPQAKVLYISGFPEQEVFDHKPGKGTVGFLQKPFTVDALASKLRQMLTDNAG